jgi:uncharacterized membrane protein YjjP (DUF1212 family)
MNQSLVTPPSKSYSAEELAEALNVITRIGVLLLESGTASFRTKDTMDRFAVALGIEQFDAFVTPTKIIGIVNSRHGSFTRALRVPQLGVNMARVSTIHTLAHHPKDMSPAELGAWLDSVASAKPEYSPLAILAGVAAACGCFAIILGGGPVEGYAAALGAACAQAVRMRLSAAHVNPYLVTALCAMLASLVAYLTMLAWGASSPRIGLIASVLLLVPGVPLITALLDLLHLDLISGVTRGVYAAILVLNIGVGMLLVLALTGFSVL